MTELSPKLEALAAAIESKLGTSLTRHEASPGELTYIVEPAELVATATVLRDDETFCFDMLVDICGVDYLSYGKAEWDSDGATNTGFSRGVHRGQDAEFVDPDTQYSPPGRFASVYHLQSIEHNHRLRLKCFCSDDERPTVDSVVPIWVSAEWYEREAFDLFGIVYVGNPDLRRLLTDYGFIGHPFRKDFPLVGNVEMRYDPSKGRVVYEPVSIEPRTLVPKTIRDDNRYDPDLKDSTDA
ncbi:MAG: NADH-quinone oxidoreductase subunit C [Gammaproteobacteria bacterium]